jgi:TIR domain
LDPTAFGDRHKSLATLSKEVVEMSDGVKDGVKLFYSYAHEDGALRDELDKYLTLLKKNGIIDSWHDRRMTAGTAWKASIDAELNSADIILLLISADFFSSEYSYDVELARAMERHDRGEAVVIPVILRPCPWKNATFSRLQALPTDGTPVIRWPQGPEDAFTNIALGIENAVNEILKKRKAPLRTTKPTVYLAETSNERRMEEYREGIAAELTAHGYPILPAPDIDLPDESPHYQNEIRRYLEGVQFSVHLIGNKYGRTIVGANDKSVVGLQNEIAEELRGQGRLESLIWIPPDVEPQGDRQIAFQRYLETDQKAQLNAELSRKGFESVKDRVIEKLKKCDRRLSLHCRTTKSVYLLCEQRDKQFVAAVKDFIFRNGFEVFLPPSVTDHGPAATFHDRCLTTCDATLIYYGEPNDDWVSLMIMDIRDAPTRRAGGGDFLCKALFLPKSDVDYQTYSAEILKYDGKSLETSLMPFIECLQRKGPNGGALQ